MEGDGGDEMKSSKVVKGLGEDGTRRVIGAALAGVCNILTYFSLLKEVVFSTMGKPNMESAFFLLQDVWGHWWGVPVERLNSPVSETI